MKILAHSVLVLALACAWCPRSFSQAVDCEKAVGSCRTQCDNTDEIYNIDEETPLPLARTDFPKRCKPACDAGLDACHTDSSCDSFYKLCVQKCPTYLVNTYADVSVRKSDAKDRCTDACAAGANLCAGTTNAYAGGKLARQKAACGNSVSACSVECGSMTVHDANADIDVEDSDFPDQCSHACDRGYGPCVKGQPDDRCELYYNGCAQACPTSVTDAHGKLLNNTNSQSQCQEACNAGRDYCQKHFDVQELKL